MASLGEEKRNIDRSLILHELESIIGMSPPWQIAKLKTMMKLYGHDPDVNGWRKALRMALVDDATSES